MDLKLELGAGPLDAALYFVGRDYGADEARLKQPFVGQAGTLLNTALRTAQINRADVRIDNLCPVQPRGNDFALHDPATLAWGRERLNTLLATHRPKVIVAFGNEVLRHLVGDALPDDGIQALRGYFWDTPFGRVLGTVHPAAILRDWTPWRALFDIDMRRARDEAAMGAPPLTTREVTVVTLPYQVEELRNNINAFRFQPDRLLSVDIENTQELQLACCGFAPSPERAWVIPANEGWQLDAIRELCESDVPKVFQNGQYDRLFLKQQCGIVVRNQRFDTQLAWHCLPGNASIDTLAGPKPIGVLAAEGEFWTWSWKDGKPWPAKATAFKTRDSAPLVRVRLLRRGKVGLKRKAYKSDTGYAPVDVVCTPEHRFRASDGRWVEARDLKCGDGLTRIRFSRDARSGRQGLQLQRKFVPASRYVLKCLGVNIPRGKQVHHIDRQPWNDVPENLAVVTRAEHNAAHGDVLWTGEHRRGLAPANLDVLGGEKRDAQTLRQLYTAGLSAAEIAHEWDCHSTAILAMMRRYAIPRRSLREAQALRRAKETNCRVLSVEVLDETAATYCLSVPETECFSTQGVIVHNSLNPELAGKKTAVGDKKAKSKRTAKSLHFLASIYLRVPWWKDYEFTTEEERFRLCGLDVCHTLEIAQKQAKQLASQNLTHIHDFEVDLLDPCLAMTERGMPVDEAKRLSMIADLKAAQAPLQDATETFVVSTVLPKFSDRLKPEKAHLFRERRVCACCRNGKAKRVACWECAGFESKPTKKQLKEWQEELRSRHTSTTYPGGEPLEVTLEPCKKCNGAGASESVVFNPNSPEQTKIVLYELLRLPARTKDNKLTTDEKALKSLLPECDRTPEAREFITKLLRLGKMTTISSILERIAPDAGGRVHSIYNPAGTESGRFASAETFLIEASTNLNNMPKREAVEALFDVQACFVAPPGYMFVAADLAGAEVYPTAAASGDLDLLDKLRAGVDVHKWTASQIFKKPIEAVTKTERILGKTARHALNYGMQWKTFMENVNVKADITGVAISAATAKQICDGYHALHPKLEKWWKRIHMELQAHGTMTTCFGRKRTFYGRNRHEYLGEAHREYIANESQSTIADLLNRGLLRWWRQHDGKIGELLAQVYDSVLILAREERAELCATLVKRCLTEEIEVHGVKLTVPVDVKIVKSLAVMKDAA